jgi:hypothetical protein
MAKEALGYLLNPAEFHDFITFCKFGLRDPLTGNYKRSPDTNGEMRGILNWLRHLFIYEANFYVSTSPVHGLIVVVPAIGAAVTWLDIHGFSYYFLRKEPFNITNLQIMVDPRPDIDALLSQSRAAFEAVPENRREELNRALRGEEGTDLDAILRELGLFDAVNPA